MIHVTVKGRVVENTMMDQKEKDPGRWIRYPSGNILTLLFGNRSKVSRGSVGWMCGTFAAVIMINSCLYFTKFHKMLLALWNPMQKKGNASKMEWRTQFILNDWKRCRTLGHSDLWLPFLRDFPKIEELHFQSALSLILSLAWVCACVILSLFLVG